MASELNLTKFFKCFPTEKEAEEYFIRLRWGTNILCPFCGSIRIVKKKNSLPMPYRCKECRKHFSVRTGNVLAESKISLQKWLLATYIITNFHKEINSVQLSKHLGVTQKTAWLLCQKLKKLNIQSKENCKEL